MRQHLLPTLCLLCDEPTSICSMICAHCQKILPILPQNCSRCGQFLPGEQTIPLDLICGNCLKNPPFFDKTFALFPYDSPIIQLITQLKFHHHLTHARAFGEYFISVIKNNWYKNQKLPDILIPVPLHFQRIRARGFNPALEIARPISKTVKIPIDKNGIIRNRNTPPQTHLNANERQKNIAGAFTAKRNYHGLFIAVLDDVITTGSTISECCRVLKAHGAAKIHVWTVARRG